MDEIPLRKNPPYAHLRFPLSPAARRDRHQEQLAGLGLTHESSRTLTELFRMKYAEPPPKLMDSMTGTTKTSVGLTTLPWILPRSIALS